MVDTITRRFRNSPAGAISKKRGHHGGEDRLYSVPEAAQETSDRQEVVKNDLSSVLRARALKFWKGPSDNRSDLCFSAVVTFDTSEAPPSENTFLLPTIVLVFDSDRVPFHCMRPSLTSLCREVVLTAVFGGSELFLRALPRFPLKPASHPGSRTFSLSI